MPDLHFFSIGDNINNRGHYGFVQKDINAAKIEDDVRDSGDILNKMGTSIPTPYARLYLFDAAFKQINTYQANPDLHTVAHDGVYDGDKTVSTAYHYLVSECLDLLEFIFKYGDQTNFGVIEWDVEKECEKLRAAEYNNQKELAESLLASYMDTSLGTFSKIYIFTWDGIIIGGTSPITLVYTSPNLRRLLKEKKQVNVFKGEQDNELFNNSKATPLYKRSESFRKFMYTYWLLELSKIEELRKTNFYTYINNSWAVYDKNINIDRNNPLLEKVKPLEATAGVIKTANVNLYCSHNIFDPSTCDYIIQPTVDIYKVEKIGDENNVVLAPAVLTQNGLDGKRYAPRCWNRASDIIPDVLKPYLTERKLPGTTFTYPYVTVDDFLAEKLIEVSYIIRKEMFHTGARADTTHLLPLKKEFFKFFKVSDIDRMVVVSTDHETGNVTVEVNVPISGGNITLKKVYKKEDKVDCYAETYTFNLAVFPSYKLPVDNVDNNMYNIILGTTVSSLNLDFYKIEDLSKAKDDQKINGVQDVLRTTVSGFETRHIRVPSAFDILELSVQDETGVYKGVIIPKFKLAPNITQQFTFCVDFGTTNTHVSYVNKPVGGAARVVTAGDIKRFDYSQDDTQIMLLNKGNVFGYSTKFKAFLQREFVPLELGTGINYPMRTTSWEINTVVAALDMFHNMNIGFNYDKELSEGNLPGQYKTNIKWAKDVLARGRMKEYFKQLLWMMKSKSVLNGGGADFNVVATYPQSMSVREAGDFKNAWNEARGVVGAQIEVKFEFESVAPYYSFLNDLKYGQPYMNLDIGGGTTDILHVRPCPGRQDQTAIFSAIFAANDIWGDGCNDANDPKENGFVAYYLQSKEFGKLNEVKKTELKSVCDNASSSSDIISYLFFHDKDKDTPTDFSQAIRDSHEMMKVPILHFSSLMYYVAFVLDLAELKIPRAITFTGMGSKYIQLITNDEQALGILISNIFAYYGRSVENDDLVNAKVEVKFASEPKLVTASGGLIMNSRAQKLIPEPCLCHGYHEENYGTSVHYRDVENYKNSVVEEFELFAKMFDDPSIAKAFSKLGYPLVQKFDKELMDLVASSFDLMIEQTSDEALKGFTVEDPMFFWPLKETLYQLSKKYASEAIQRITERK